ncbi:nitrogenase stabilizing/protective protein NifW [Bradyrhizobium sp. CB82]|uniref:nitrogenase stabilizing/protective protein NifW n=1 Tax=Bradyrhizobium sp. CB82 TaxID=3039159 RepID=UPI0024B26D4F|nr:nitrogenase stabilizing/protective protein NifW [Bradyrhizobium sp. CB82]WFU45234.1 nitrogenase stabilizing/protective protein NifW [Bradyrhizobium sp. CB82]
MMSNGILFQLGKAAAAEEFFELLGVKYDPKIVNVARLHILRRMGQYLAAEDLNAATDAEVAERCKAVLERAYADFVASSPIDQRVFKVLKEAVAPRPKKALPLVKLDRLK